MALVLGQKFQKHREFDKDVLLRDLQQLVSELQTELKAQTTLNASLQSQITTINARLAAASIP